MTNEVVPLFRTVRTARRQPKDTKKTIRQAPTLSHTADVPFAQVTQRSSRCREHVQYPNNSSSDSGGEPMRSRYPRKPRKKRTDVPIAGVVQAVGSRLFVSARPSIAVAGALPFFDVCSCCRYWKYNSSINNGRGRGFLGVKRSRNEDIMSIRRAGLWLSELFCSTRSGAF